MGRNKALLEINHTPILEYVIKAVTPLTSDLFLVTNQPEVYRHFHLPMVRDIMPEKAALGGLYTAISAAQNDWILVVGCDMPLLKAEVIDFMAGYLNQGDIVCPLIGVHPEPLHAFYQKTCLPFIKERLLNDQLKLTGFYEAVTVQYIDESLLSQVTTDLNFLRNVNTPQDFVDIQRLIG
jgi:molybdopterin-guanine dinucleotide biosynthesis protein A